MKSLRKGEMVAPLNDPQNLGTLEAFSFAAHELKTPITALLLELQLLEKALASNPSANARELRHAASAMQLARRLAALADQVLSTSQAGCGQMQLNRETLDLSEVVNEACVRLRNYAQAQGCEFEVRPSGSCVGEWDRLRVEQALDNLLTNACKFGKGAPIEILIEDLGDRAELSVSDQGPGLAPEDRERIFRPFQRAHSAEKVPGFGIGLFVVTEVARAHGGGIRVESSLGRGAKFVLSLPKKPL